MGSFFENPPDALRISSLHTVQLTIAGVGGSIVGQSCQERVGDVAQLVERRNGIAEATGSTPVVSTNLQDVAARRWGSGSFPENSITMEAAANQDLQRQIQALDRVLRQSPVLLKVLERAPQLGMPNWYLGAGCIAQTVWNLQHGFDVASNIKDCDLVYYDSSATSYEAEDVRVQKGKELFKDIPLRVEIMNEARVHLWYEKHFGYKIRPYPSVEAAINTWPTTATSVGVRWDEAGQLRVYAPFGLYDLFGMIVRANRAQITEEIYLAKVERWTKVWRKLTVIPWSS